MLASDADTFILSCLASTDTRFLDLMADSLAVIRSTTGTGFGETGKLNPLAWTLFSGWVRSLLDKFLIHLSSLSVVFSCL